MPDSLLGNLFSHWYKPFDGFKTSAMDFYSAVESGLGRRQIPGIQTSRVTWHEGGIGTPKREYLRISRNEMAFDICAAPLGTGYFFSWWLGSPGARLVHWVILFIATLMLFSVIVAPSFDRQFEGTMWRTILFLAILAPTYRVMALVGSYHRSGIDDAAGKVPLIGLLYRSLFTRLTYYRIDTMLMFQSAVHSVVCEVIDGLTSANGLRALEADEKKPIMRDFLKR